MERYKRPEPGDRIALAVSGGIDSAVAANLLLEEGFEVTGFHLILNRASNSLEEARGVASLMGIELQVVDAADDFERLVVGPFVNDYTCGRTPSPCVACNPLVKFGMLARHALARGIGFWATGHYARTGFDEALGRPILRRAADRAKDQTYFLSRLTPEMIGRAVFPLADLTKDGVRRRAAALGIPERAESQEICFLAGENYRDFLEKRLGKGVSQPGDVVDSGGAVLGRHDGIAHYTVGQRRGLGIPGSEPYYVLHLDAARNRVVIGTKAMTFGTRFSVRGLVWPVPPASEVFPALVQIRSRHRPAPALVRLKDGGSADVEFETPQSSITPGQAAVFYDNDLLLGSGWIERRYFL